MCTFNEFIDAIYLIRVQLQKIRAVVSEMNDDDKDEKEDS